MSAPQRLAGDNRAWFDGLPRALDEALDDFDVTSTDAWKDVAELSQRTEFNEIEVYGEASVTENGKTFAPATVYVDLVYEPGPDEVSFSESFPARIYFKSKDNEVTITDLSIDTSTFSE